MQGKTTDPGAAPASGKKAAPTYTKDVAPILQAKCQNCHRRHQVGPFALETYEQARKRSRDIAAVTEERSMPPWKPTAGVGPKLKHDQSLTHAEIAILAAWAEAGAPRGDPKDLPPPPKFAEGWKLGPPDLILEPSEGFPVPASGPDVYRCFVLPTNLAQDAYLEAVDYAPGERGAVHHLIAYIDTTGRARQLDAAAPGPGYSAPAGPGIEADELSFWTAGSEPHRLPDGIGIHIPAQSDIVLQVHYHPTGKAGIDRTRVGLYFCRKPVKQALHWNNATSYNFRLPAGDDNVEVKASWFVPVDVEALAVSPHMHQLGHDMHMSVQLAQRPHQEPDRDRRLGPLLAERLLLPEADHAARRLGRQRRRALRQLRPRAQPQPAAEAGQGRAQRRRRDVRRLHRRGEEGPGPDHARGPRRPVRDLHQAARADFSASKWSSSLTKNYRRPGISAAIRGGVVRRQPLGAAAAPRP